METESPDLECFLCRGTGRISKDRLYRELGLRQLADVAKMGVQETLDALNRDGFKFFQSYREELAKTVEQRFAEKLEAEHARAEREKARLGEDAKRMQEELAILKRERQTLQDELTRARATSARKGEQGEVDFVSFLAGRRDLRLSDKLAQRGDYLLSVLVDRPDGTASWLPDVALVDVKKDRPLGAEEVGALARDAAHRKLRIGFLVATKPEQLRGKDPIAPLQERNGVFVVATLMEELPATVDLLRPFLQVLATAKPEEKDETWQAKFNAIVAEVTRSFMEIDKITQHTESINKVVEGIKKRLQAFCTTTVAAQ